MDVFYEESAVARDSKKGERRYKIANVVSNIALVLAILFLMFFLFMMPWGAFTAPDTLPDGTTLEELQAIYEGQKFIAIFCALNGGFFLLFWFFLFKMKSRFNVSYDYCFVSGELRISKVFNINKRKLLTRFDAMEILQIGDVDNSSYERLKSDPSTKEVICTPNVEAMDGKFFMYILVNDNGKKLYVLECRELLLMNIMKFAKRNVLESDYVMQERKQQKKV